MTSLHLPSLNASLNAAAGVFLLLGFFFIKRKNVPAHRLMMTLAFLMSTLFLASYLYYHFHFGSTRFQGTGWIRPVYFFILITHTVLATALVPFVLLTVFRAIKKQFDRHARLARWVWPVWMYVSVSGVLVYWMLYRI